MNGLTAWLQRCNAKFDSPAERAAARAMKLNVDTVLGKVDGFNEGVVGIENTRFAEDSNPFFRRKFIAQFM